MYCRMLKVKNRYHLKQNKYNNCLIVIIDMMEVKNENIIIIFNFNICKIPKFTPMNLRSASIFQKDSKENSLRKSHEQSSTETIGFLK